MITRRDWMAGMMATAGVAGLRSRGVERLLWAFADAPAPALRPEGVLIESHVHLFSDDPAKFPLANGSYKPSPVPVESYVKFAVATNLNHTVIVHPEPYQDDHRYLEYCFTQEPSKGYFKATCLFDPIDPATPARLKDLVQRNPNRIVALRIHELHPAGTPSTTSGVIRDRDLKSPQMEITWKAAHDLGLGILIQLIPHYAEQIGDLAKKFPNIPVMLDHLARPGQGTAEEYEQVLKLADLKNVYMKYTTTGVESAVVAARAQSGATASTSGEQPSGRGQRGPGEPYPYPSAKPLIKRVYGAFGADKIMWGELGTSAEMFDKAANLLDVMFDSVPEVDRKKMRGLTAQKLFAFS